MTAFKIGDRVRLNVTNRYGLAPEAQRGLGTVTQHTPTGYYVQPDDFGGGALYYRESELELAPEPKFKVGDRVRWSQGASTYEILGRSADLAHRDNFYDWRIKNLRVGNELNVKEHELELIEPEPVYDIKPGDHFRYTVEGVYEPSGGKGGVNVGTYGVERDFDLHSGGDDTIVIEKIEPPVVTFGPGDYVRAKGSRFSYLVTSEGYVALGGFEYVKGRHYSTAEPFTSEHYEKVELAEVPF